MAEVAACADAQTLKRFSLGLLPAEEADALAEHLLRCARCIALLDGLAPGDALTAGLAGATVPDEPPESVRRLMERLSTWRPALPGEGTVDQSSPREESVADANGPAARLDFLAPPQRDDEVGRLGSYRVLGVLGRGGMGMVLLAEDTRLERPAALKVMLPKLAEDPRARQRFLREARSAAALKHDHIVTIYQVDEDRGVPFLAMEYLEGRPLDQWLKGGALPAVAEVVRIGREAAEGLAAAHAKGLIHRDIKPGNLWLEGERRRVKILDFGLARAQAEDVHLTGSGVLLGTPAFMAPEQAEAHATVDHRSDLFSLGCVLYRLCTGALPFPGDSTMAVLRALAMHEPAPPRALNPEVPEALSRLVVRLLAKDPARRPASAQEVVQELQEIERSLAAPAAKRLRRRPMVWVAAGVLTLAAAAAAIVLSIPAPDGTLRVQIEDDEDEMEVTVKGPNVVLRKADGQRDIAVRPGKQRLHVKRGDFEFETDKLVLRRGEKVVVDIRLLPGKVQVVRDGVLIEECPLPPRSQWALEFDGEASYVEVPSLRFDSEQPHTLEGWVTVEDERGSALLARVAGTSWMSLSAGAGKWAVIGLIRDQQQGVLAPDTVTRGVKTHVAGTWDGKGFRMFVNGKEFRDRLHALQKPGQIKSGQAGITQIGGAPGSSAFLRGWIHGLRVSKTARYDKDFTPAPRFAIDGDTLAVYHLDEGQGDRLIDSSGNNHHGKIVGAKWVKSGGGAGPCARGPERRCREAPLAPRGCGRRPASYGPSRPAACCVPIPWPACGSGPAASDSAHPARYPLAGGAGGVARYTWGKPFRRSKQQALPLRVGDNGTGIAEPPTFLRNMHPVRGASKVGGGVAFLNGQGGGMPSAWERACLLPAPGAVTPFA